MAKKDKKGKKEEEPPEPEIPDELLLGATDLEPEPEEIQWTDTSYTSASFESLPPAPVEEVKKKPKKKKKVVEEEVVKEEEVAFQWSEESLPVQEEEEEKKVVEEQEVEEKKGKKGKKGKKPKEEIPEFEKPKEWKKMNKKERELWLVNRIEEWRAEMEAEKQAILAGAKEKRLALAKERADLLAKDNAEQEIRRDILAKTCALFSKFEREKIEFVNNLQRMAEWQQYLRCDGLPDPRVPTQMNTYLHVWQNTNACDTDELDRRCVEALPMMLMLEEMVANPKQFTPLQLQSYDEVRLQLREQLSETIQCASYMILRNLEKNLKFESIKLATYNREFKGLKLNIWVAVRMPTRKLKPVEPEPEPVELEFPALNVGLKLPKTIDGSCVCVRAARSEVDLLSESSRSYALAAEVANRYTDLFVFMVKEHMEMLKIKAEQDAIRTAFYKEINARIKEVENFLKANQYTKNEKEKEELDNLNMSEPPLMTDPRTLIGENNELAFQKYLKKCMTRTRTGEVHLRKYRICGGTLNLDLLIVPPQPKRLRNNVLLSTLQLPKRLTPMPYQVQFRAPGPPPPGVTRTPEEIEAEMKKVEAEYEKLALVFIQLPQDIMWSEPPVICQWQENRKLWTSNYINDYKFNEDKLTVQFRTGVLWPIGIATLRYSNMPYQGWDMRPDPNGKGVLLSVTGACVTVTWICVGNSVKLKWIANATTRALREHFGKKYSVKGMVQLMRAAACDFFPDFDGHNHLEGTCPKEWVIERHTYHAMAMLSRAYNFQWSRWNVGAGSRNIVMQLREAVDKKREAKFNLLYANPKQATILKCNELSTELTLEPMVGLGFYPDLFTLNMSYGSVDARRATFNIKFSLVETVFEMLQELKVSSFS
ncbi:dynein axonemal intermediate chain 7-like isoform X1 [Cydia pomonella]|uniref:dynein axonemal intermediate chain 7-like isoform X1 n=1 Tax=Cydia pomonella TaxID=82600 RepID=UPI002ADD9297|nr:dynein axonemal intermediate chain 7-like isoform X1 [Cydia pomonella]